MDMELKLEMNKHNLAVLNALTSLGRTLVDQIIVIGETINKGDLVGVTADRVREAWTKELYNQLVKIYGENHDIILQFKNIWKL